MSGRIEAALRRRRAITLAALAMLTLFAWAWLLAGAGMGMERQATLHPFPHLTAEDARGMAMTSATGFSFAYGALGFAMWWTMMVAMMLPAATPTILLYARAAGGREAQTAPSTGHFLLGYLIVWGAFSLLAAALQVALEISGALDAMTMGSAARWLSAAILLAAGVYQLSPLKDACLSHCRNPAAFLSRHFRPGRQGAVRLGLLHGAYCVGCCWLLMALLFVGGVMNLAWIALLTLLVAAEKLLPGGRLLALAAGVGFIVWGGFTAFV